MLPSIQPFSGDGSLASSVTNSNSVTSERETNFKFLAEWIVNPDPIISAIYTATERQDAFPRDIVNLVTEYLQNHEALKSLSMFGPADWTTTFNKKVELIQPPPEMDAFLQRINPFTGKLNAESCLCVFIPSHYQDIPPNAKEEQELVNHPLIPLTPVTMGELAKNPSNPEKQSKFKWFLENYNNDSFAIEEKHKELRKRFQNLHAKKSYWVVITPDVIPDSRSKSYFKQKNLINKKGFKEYWEAPSVREAIICAFAHYAKTGIRILNDNPCTFTRCVERIDGHQLFVGFGFGEKGLIVDAGSSKNASHGVVVRRKFTCKALGS